MLKGVNLLVGWHLALSFGMLESVIGFFSPCVALYNSSWCAICVSLCARLLYVPNCYSCGWWSWQFGSEELLLQYSLPPSLSLTHFCFRIAPDFLAPCSVCVFVCACFLISMQIACLSDKKHMQLMYMFCSDRLWPCNSHVTVASSFWLPLLCQCLFSVECFSPWGSGVESL